ncbi:hypothetical protein EH65_00015 [Escherichia coli]|nr:hypothetical protein EH65_00015 [Escherichia coli]
MKANSRRSAQFFTWHISTPGVSRAMKTRCWTMEHIGNHWTARQVTDPGQKAVLQKSLEITEEADLALRNAMARIK